MIAPLFLLIGQIYGGDPRRTYAAGDKDAVLMLPPVAVCDADVRGMVWAADGSALVVRRSFTDATPADLAAGLSGKPTPELMARFEPKSELLVWSPRSHKARTVVTGSARSFEINAMRAMPGSDRIVVDAVERTTDADGATKETLTVSMLAPGSATLTRLAVPDEATPFVDFEVSPTRPLGYVLGFQRTRTQAVRFFGPDGRLGGLLPLPPKTHLAWDPKGAPILVLGHDTQGKTVTFHYQRVDAASGTLGERYDAGIEGEYDPSPLKATLEAVPARGTADGAAAPSILLRVPGGKPGEAGVVTTDGTGGLVSPKGDAIAYLAQGGAAVRPLAHVDRAAYEAAMLAAKKTVAISNAKQAGLATIMFASDHDDRLPGQSEISGIMDYLKDRGIFDSFTYTYAGGLMTDIESPAETEIGYVLGPGGRAVVYSDGHVKWRPDQP